MSPHTVEKLSDLGFLRSQDFNDLGTTVFHVWNKYGERPISGVPCVTP